MSRGARAHFAGIVVAAGRSTRMGRPKGLLTLSGSPDPETVLARLVRVFRESALDPIVVVASGATLEAARTLSDARAVEGDADAPMIDSIARGLDAIPGVPGAVVQPVDAPFTTTDVIARLLAGTPSRPRVLTHAGAPGHPVLVVAPMFPAIQARPDGGLRRVLAGLDVEHVETDDARILADLDTPVDLERWAHDLERSS